MESVASSSTTPTPQPPAAPSSGKLPPIPTDLMAIVLRFLPPQRQIDLAEKYPAFADAFKLEDKKALTPLKTLAKNLAELVEREDSECPEEITKLSREISEILETPGTTFFNKETQIFIKLLELSPASFAYLYTKFNIEECYFEGSPAQSFPYEWAHDPNDPENIIVRIKPDKINAAYAYVQDPNHPHTILVQAQFYRGCAMGYISDQKVFIKEEALLLSDLIKKELAEKGQLRLAKVIYDLQDPRFKWLFASEFSECLAKADRPGAALQLAAHINDLYLQSYALQEIGKSFARVGGHFEDACKAMKDSMDLMRTVRKDLQGTEYCLKPEELLEMANPLLQGERLDLVLDLFSHYQNMGDGKWIDPSVYQAIFQHVNEEHHAYQHGPRWKEMNPEALEAGNQALLAKAKELAILARHGKPDTVVQSLSELENREDRKLCYAYIAIQIHSFWANERSHRQIKNAAAHYYASLIK